MPETTTPAFEHLLYEQDGHVLTITLNRPEALNALSRPLETELHAALDVASADDGVRSIILTGAGRAFSAGYDIASGEGPSRPRVPTSSYLRAGYQSAMRNPNLMMHVMELPKPVIAAVHGWCIGGGVDLASACDLRIATRDSKFSVRETRIAIVADLGSLQRLPRLIGQGNTRELAFTGKDIDSARAKEMGLVNQVVDDVAALGDAATAMAREIASNSPLTVRGVKRVLDYGEGKPVADGLSYVAAWNAAFLASDDLGEALAAFTEKRPPRFKGQ